MSDLHDFKGLFDNLGNVQAPVQPSGPSLLTPPAPPPVQKDNASPEVMAQVQTLVWGNGPQVGPPPPKQQDKGQAPILNQKQGWGQV